MSEEDEFIAALESDAQDFSQKWHRLARLFDEWTERIRADPIHFCKIAWDEAFQQRLKAHKAKEAYYDAVIPPVRWQEYNAVPRYEPDQIIQVRKKEYDALKQFYQTMTEGL